MIFRYRIILADLWLHVVNPTNVLLVLRQFAKPRASADIITCSRVDPDIINTIPDLIDPSENIVTTVFFPHTDVVFSGTGVVAVQIQAAVATLLAGKTFRRYSIARFHYYAFGKFVLKPAG